MDPHAANTGSPAPAKIIGGMFGLETHFTAGGTIPHFLLQSLATINARSALRLAIEYLAPKQVWFPSYFCESMLTAIEGLPTRLRFFGIGDSLQMESLDWLDEFQPGDVVVLIEYFGFPCDDSWLERVHEIGGVAILDAAQSLLTDHSYTHADMCVSSPRKFVGVPDGGILEFNSHAEMSSSVALGPAPAEWLELARQATLGRSEFDRHGGDRKWFTQFQEVEATQPVGAYRMSEFTRDLLVRIDYSRIAERRRENYGCLLNELQAIAIFSHLPDGVVPLGFPIRLPERDRVRQTLFAEQIYPPVHWPIPPLVPAKFAASHELSRQQLTLPCDQRYTTADMRRMANIVRQEAGL